MPVTFCNKKAFNFFGKKTGLHTTEGKKHCNLLIVVFRIDTVPLNVLKMLSSVVITTLLDSFGFFFGLQRTKEGASLSKTFKQHLKKLCTLGVIEFFAVNESTLRDQTVEFQSVQNGWTQFSSKTCITASFFSFSYYCGIQRKWPNLYTIQISCGSNIVCGVETSLRKFKTKTMRK